MNEDAVLPGFAPLIDRYDTFVLDQWGVLHEGNQLYRGVRPLLEELQRRGKKVMILTNSSKSSDRNIQRLAERFGVPRDCYQTLISSADLIRSWLGGEYAIDDLSRPGSVLVRADEGDEQLLDGIEVRITGDTADADAVILLSLPVTDTIDDHRWWMETTVARDLPLLCPSNDVHTVRPNGVHAGMAGIIHVYADLGGRVYNVGKPSPHIYAICNAEMASADPGSVLMVGDQIASDVAGARTQGWHTALVKTGAGRDALASSDIRPDYVLDALAL